MSIIADGSVRASAEALDRLIGTVCEALRLAASELEGGPLGGDRENLVPRAAAGAFRDLAALVDVVMTTNSVMVLDLVRYGLFVASDSVRSLSGDLDGQGL
ncbi:hypothetical protein [Frankia sp. AgB32]|uniref:hypothetical protein n=1 Tax=Frankia sp. AgB32 TaxID=631119 RepID=UPI00200E45FE|nr:hypothetical protein [Frankia sp. AgB32]MCK9893376.1 hypothetical protein [Frankia sp. AgB32]